MTTDRFTESGDASIERAIGELVETVAIRARAIPGLEALLLGGSLGRGEGTVERAADGDRLASDVEVYLVGRSPSLRAAARGLEVDLASEKRPRVSAAWLHPDALRHGRAKNLSRRPSSTIRLYELAAASRVLVGTRPAIHKMDPSDLPLGEGVRLVLNRLAEAAPELARHSPQAAFWTDKVLIACGDTVLLSKGAYTARYRDRLTRLSQTDPAWPMPDGWREVVAAAYERKLNGSGLEADEVRDADAVVVATLSAVERVTGTALEPLGTFPQRFVLAGARRPELLRYLPPLGPKATFEGIVLLVRARRAGHPVTARMLWQALLGRPLSLSLQATALPLYLGVVRGEPGLLLAAARAMVWAGLPPGEVRRAVDAPARLADLLRRRWMVAT